MPTRRTRGTRSSPHGIIGSVALLLAITASAALAGSSRSAREPERIFVTALSGTVSVTMAGASTPVQLDSTVGLPARIVTGDDGMLSLTQAGTNVTIAADSDVEIPAEASDGQLIARLVQRRGNVFYDVAHREAGTLRVETPFLVAVIKGTQFNVAVEEGGSTISLFQGRLEIKTPDGTDSVFINAGQIARRANADKAISVIGMNDVRLLAPRTGDAVARSVPANNNALQPRVFAVATDARDAPATATLARIESVTSPGEVDGPGSGIATGVDRGASVSVGRTLHVGNGPAASVNASTGLGTGGLPASVGANLNVGTGSADVSVGVGGGVPASASANLNVGAGSSGVSLGTGAGVSAGGVSASAGATLGVSAGSSGASAGTSAAVAADGVPASTGANLNVVAGGSGVSVGTGATAAAGGVAASAGANLNVAGGSSGASLGAGVSLGTVSGDVGLGKDGLHLDLGGKGDDHPGLHLGNGGSIGDNLGLHLGNGNPAPAGKSHGHK